MKLCRTTIIFLRLLPISNTNAVLFMKEHRRFLMGEREDGWQMLYHALIFSHDDADELTRAADRFFTCCT